MIEKVAPMLALTLTASSRSFAQTRSPRTPEVENVVVTGTRTPEQSQRATVKTDVVTQEEAERRGATNVAEALASQPGVQVNPGAYGFLGGLSAIQIQGFDLSRVLILEDGEPTIGDIGGGIDLAALPIGDIKRIEVVTGPTSALYGSNAIGGVVNILTAPPRLPGLSGRSRVEARSHLGRVVQVNGSLRKQDTWAGVDVNYTGQEGIQRIPDLPDLQIPETDRLMLGARGGTSLSDRIDVRVRARWIADRSEGRTSRVAPGAGRYTIEQPAQTDRFALHLIETFNLGRGSSLRVTMGKQWVDNETQTRQLGSRVGDERMRTQRMHSLEAVTTIAEGARTWVFGGRAQVEHFTQSIAKTESLTSGLATTSRLEVTPVQYGTLAAYGQLQWKLASGLTLLPGVRTEMHTRYGSSVTPRLAIAYKMHDTLHWRASFGRGFRAPSAKELGFSFDHSVFGYRVQGNADLRPETSYGTNADVTYLPTRRIRVRAGVFMNWVDDLIDIDLASGSATAGAIDYRYKNFGKARTFGAQVDGSVQVNKHLRSEVSYDYLWTRDDLNDRPLGGRPPHTVTCSLRITPSSKLEAYVRLRTVTDAFATLEARSPGYSMVDLRAGYALWPRSQAYVGVLNLFDAHQEPGRVGDLRPPLGRVLYAGLRAEIPLSEDE